MVSSGYTVSCVMPKPAHGRTSSIRTAAPSSRSIPTSRPDIGACGCRCALSVLVSSGASMAGASPCMMARRRGGRDTRAHGRAVRRARNRNRRCDVHGPQRRCCEQRRCAMTLFGTHLLRHRHGNCIKLEGQMLLPPQDTMTIRVARPLPRMRRTRDPRRIPERSGSYEIWNPT